MGNRLRLANPALSRNPTENNGDPISIAAQPANDRVPFTGQHEINVPETTIRIDFDGRTEALPGIRRKRSRRTEFAYCAT